MSVEKQYLMACFFEQMSCDAELQRKVWRTTAEIDAPVEPPPRVDENDPHSRISAATARDVFGVKACVSQSSRRASPVSIATCGTQDNVLRRFCVSETYQGW